MKSSYDNQYYLFMDRVLIFQFCYINIMTINNYDSTIKNQLFNKKKIIVIIK